VPSRSRAAGSLGYARNVRWAVLILGLVACEFPHSKSPVDGPPIDVPSDPPPNAKWAIDATSGKSVPGTSVEWLAFIADKQLGITAPDGLWLMQEASGTLQDSIGMVHLASIGSVAAQYQQTIAGWTRRAVKSVDGSDVSFSNTTDALPVVSNTSMTVLMYYATTTNPQGKRSILVAGCCAGYATVSIDGARHFGLQVNTSGNATGTLDHGSEVIPLVLKLDKTSSRQVIITNRETITPPYTQLGSFKGLFLAAANGGAPEGRWLYMAAWYGANAEMSDASISALIKALGW
jgi:hypothetical protein